jgi:hypothetical protein
MPARPTFFSGVASAWAAVSISWMGSRGAVL